LVFVQEDVAVGDHVPCEAVHVKLHRRAVHAVQDVVPVPHLESITKHTSRRSNSSSGGGNQEGGARRVKEGQGVRWRRKQIANGTRT